MTPCVGDKLWLKIRNSSEKFCFESPIAMASKRFSQKLGSFDICCPYFRLSNGFWFLWVDVDIQNFMFGGLKNVCQQNGSGSSLLIVGLVFVLWAVWSTMTPKTCAVQRLPKPSAPEHHDFNEAPGNPFTFEMEIPEWLMESLGAGPKTGSFVNHSVLDFSSSVWRRLLSLCLCIPF